MKYLTEIDLIKKLKNNHSNGWGRELAKIIEIELSQGKTLWQIQFFLNENQLNINRKCIYNIVDKYKIQEKVKSAYTPKSNFTNSTYPKIEQSRITEKTESIPDLKPTVDFSKMSDDEFKKMIKQAEENSQKKLFEN